MNIYENEYQNLNRSERRRLGKKLKTKIPSSPTLNIKADNLKILHDQEAEKAAFKVFVQYMGLPLMVLHDKFGFGNKRMVKFCKELFELYDHVDAGRVSAEELSQMVKEETGISLHRQDGKFSATANFEVAN